MSPLLGCVTLQDLLVLSHCLANYSTHFENQPFFYLYIKREKE